MTTFSFSRRTRNSYHRAVPTPNTGFCCLKCQTAATNVLDSRQNDDGFIRRRRECPVCNYRFSTVEVPIDQNPSAAHGKRAALMQKLLPKLFALADQIDLLRAEHD